MNGFLPSSNYIPPLPADFAPWENAANNLSKLLIAEQLRSRILELSPPDCAVLAEAQLEAEGASRYIQISTIQGTPQASASLERAMQIFSYLGNAYVWGQQPLVDRIPAQLAKPWCEVAARLARKPMLSYASTTLYNWHLLDPAKPIELGNLVIPQNFLGGQDEDWFIQVHIAIEAAASPAVGAILPIQAAVEQGEVAAVQTGLQTISDSLEKILGLMQRMYEKCDPHIYYHRLRPFLFGWFNNPALPQGMMYEGVFDNQPQHFHGQTGAQSSIVPALDALLGIELSQDSMRVYLEAMRGCMPLAHRRFLRGVQRGASLRGFAQSHLGDLRNPYNGAVKLLNAFRSAHINLAGKFVHEPGLKYAQGAVGTGGTSFMTYLSSRQQGTSEHLL